MQQPLCFIYGSISQHLGSSYSPQRMFFSQPAVAEPHQRTLTEHHSTTSRAGWLSHGLSSTSPVFPAPGSSVSSLFPWEPLSHQLGATRLGSCNHEFWPLEAPWSHLLCYAWPQNRLPKKAPCRKQNEVFLWIYQLSIWLQVLLFSRHS